MDPGIQQRGDPKRAGYMGEGRIERSDNGAYLKAELEASKALLEESAHAWIRPNHGQTQADAKTMLYGIIII